MHSLLLMQELETRLTGYLERGASIEAELLTAAAAVLPEDVRRQMPPELKDILLRGSVDKRVSSSVPTRQEAADVPIASVTKSQTRESLPYQQLRLANTRHSPSVERFKDRFTCFSQLQGSSRCLASLAFVLAV